MKAFKKATVLAAGAAAFVIPATSVSAAELEQGVPETSQEEVLRPGREKGEKQEIYPDHPENPKEKSHLPPLVPGGAAGRDRPPAGSAAKRKRGEKAFGGRLRGGGGSGVPGPGLGSLPGSAAGRRFPKPRAYCPDENRRRENPGGPASVLSVRPVRPRGPCGDLQRLPGPAGRGGTESGIPAPGGRRKPPAGRPTAWPGTCGRGR